MEDSNLMMEMLRGMLEKIDTLQDRITKLEEIAEETSAGVYYDHLDKTYVDYIDTKIVEKRRGDK